ncbi:hypothetical protein SCHPADRAFT_911701 [Schizopora paradoxa]|uniref:F-box domain-containing protein n=1 Tax=Schizopora paradoxa TaxID=27342 RepID=A0A0H2QZC1_9AGAM|nr:hypothetical protein SCHPADRAFT_911701 [Schizopora paradoxa]
MLSGEYLSGVGFLHTPEPGVISTRSFMQLNSMDMFSGLAHWRISQYFSSVEALAFKLSPQDNVRNEQLSSLARFFASLPPFGFNCRVVNIFLEDFEEGVDLQFLTSIMAQLHRTGCVDFRIQSSYLAKPARFDVPPTDVDNVFTHNMERLFIHSPAIFSASLMPWFIGTLVLGATLTSVDVLSVGLGPLEWAAILPGVFLPFLRELRLVGVDLPTLIAFLHRHSSLLAIYLDGLRLTDDPQVFRLSLTLPRLRTIEGDEWQILCFLQSLAPLESQDLLTVSFRDDYSMAAKPLEPFDTDACLRSFSLLTELVGESYLTLYFNFTNLRRFSTFSEDRTSNSPNSCPERYLRVDRMEINIFGQSQSDCTALLENCIEWTPLFSRIKVLRIWVGEMMLTDDARQGYLQRLSLSLPETTISLV